MFFKNDEKIMLQSLFEKLKNNFSDFEFKHDTEMDDKQTTFRFHLKPFKISHIPTKSKFVLEEYARKSFRLEFLDPVSVEYYSPKYSIILKMAEYIEDIFPFVVSGYRYKDREQKNKDLMNSYLQNPSSALIFSFNYNDCDLGKHVELYSWIKNNCIGRVRHAASSIEHNPRNGLKFISIFDDNTDLMAVKLKFNDLLFDRDEK